MINKNIAATRNVPKKIAKVFSKEVILVVFLIKTFPNPKKTPPTIARKSSFPILKKFSTEKNVTLHGSKIKIRKAPAIAIEIAINDVNVGFSLIKIAAKIEAQIGIR